ncbi:MAG: hypothetical protein QOF73_3303, partial [Thermomicrobiales bacterium]|nr:hypothetical protein [Thermomicrobiales bacterium]
MTDTATRLTSWSDQAVERDILDSISLDAPWPTIERFANLVRLSGSREEREAVDDLIAQLSSWGVPYQLHEPVCFISIPLEATVRVNGANGKSFRAKTTAMSVSTDGRELAGELVYVPPKIREDVADDWSYGLDFTGLDVAGKIVIADGM